MARILAGHTTARFTPERVLAEKGLTGRISAEELARAAAPFDDKSKGYLSEAELRRGADALLASGAPAARHEGMRFHPSALAGVQESVLKPNSVVSRFSTDEILAAAAGWDDGNGYLNKKELTAGALELQRRAASGALSAADVAFIRDLTGVSSSGPAPSPAALTDLVEDLDGSGVRALLATHIPALDVADLEADADEVIDNRDGSRTTPFTFSVEPKDGAKLEVTLYSDFDYDGTSFSHYATFEVSSDGNFTLTDSGAD